MALFNSQMRRHMIYLDLLYKLGPDYQSNSNSQITQNWNFVFHISINKFCHGLAQFWHISSQFTLLSLNTYGFFLLVWYKKLGIVHCTYLGMSGYIVFFCLMIFFYCYKQCNEALCCISSGSSPLLSNATVGALIRNVGPSESMIRLSFNMAAASHTWFRNKEF